MLGCALGGARSRLRGLKASAMLFGGARLRFFLRSQCNLVDGKPGCARCLYCRTPWLVFVQTYCRSNLLYLVNYGVTYVLHQVRSFRPPQRYSGRIGPKHLHERALGPAPVQVRGGSARTSSGREASIEWI